MIIIKISGLVLVACLIIIFLKRYSPEFSLILSLLTGVIIFYLIMPDLKLVLEIINNINQKFNIRQDFIKILIKIIGIAYICEFISQVCIDSEQKNLADKINLAGKILIMSVSLPIVIEVLNLIYEF